MTDVGDFGFSLSMLFDMSPQFGVELVHYCSHCLFKLTFLALAGPTQEELLSLLGQCDLHVSPQHALAIPSNCSPTEMSNLLNRLLLRSSCQSLASTDASPDHTDQASTKRHSAR